MTSEYRLRKRTYILLACLVFFNSVGNVLLSKGMKQVGEVADFSPSALVQMSFKIFLNANIWFGMVSLLLFLVSYMLILSWADLSYVQPASAIAYAIVPLLGYLLLGELVPPTRWVGVLFISAGVVLVGGTAPGTTGGK
jgi:drug/metabolite transporter (DMT)-like permease